MSPGQSFDRHAAHAGEAGDLSLCRGKLWQGCRIRAAGVKKTWLTQNGSVKNWLKRVDF
jgi:hypothetical protein